MVGDTLSQEEINALLSGEGGDNLNQANAPIDSVPDEVIGVLEEFGTIFSQALKEVFDTLLGKETKVPGLDIKKNTLSVMQTEIGEKGIVSKLFLNTNVNYNILFATNFAAQCADLMMMGDGKAEFNPEEHIDAINEMLNQIQGVIASKLTNSSGKSVSFEPTESTLEDVFNVDILYYQYVISFTISIGDEFFGSILILASKEFVDSITNLLHPPAAQETAATQPTQNADTSSASAMGMDADVRPAVLPQFDSSTSQQGMPKNIELLLDVTLDMNVELGRTRKTVKEILSLGPGSIIQLNKMAGEPVDVLVNDQLIAQGEVVVVAESFGVRITNLVSPEERIKKLGGRY